MEMSGNECLDLFRKIPKTVAQGLLLDLVVVNDGVENLKANSELFFASAKQLIEQKKR